jgi:hypothetical protein
MSERAKARGFRARAAGLVVHDLDDEVLVYDLDRHRAHCLNRTAAAIWRLCDGKRSAAAIARALTAELGTPVDQEMIWSTLDRLGKARLLDQPVARPTPPRGISRRRALRGLLIATPAVVSVLSPTPAQAATCFPSGHPCVVGRKQCCSGVCVQGRCL